MRETAADRRPRVALLVADGGPDTCEAWLAAAGADVTVLEHGRAGLTLAGADALVLSGSVHDVHPAVYGEAKGPDVGVTCLASDRRDLALVGQALADDLPLVGICRGSQLLNIALGGSLWQDLDPTSVTHPTDEPHPIRTGDGSPLRDIIGRTAAVGGAHHQAVRRLGRGVRPTAVSSDGVVESIDVPVPALRPRGAVASRVRRLGRGGAAARRRARAGGTHGAAPGGARPGSRSLVPSG
jgi:gamma-glutamyl-gamma-aminobutyrate hydrolase PuuD